MLPINIENDPINQANISIYSEAYFGGIPTFIKVNPRTYVSGLAEIHRYLYRTKHKPDPNEVTYHKISIDYLDDLFLLHREWMPIEYNRDYFKKFLFRRTYFNCGAFVKFQGREFLIGCILGEECKESIFRQNAPSVLKPKNCFKYFFGEPEKFSYLNSLGVIDEYRKLKIGTKLLQIFLEEMNKRNCVASFLHCIEHNSTAISFYEMNKWMQGGILNNYYYIDENYYDAIVFYNIHSEKEEFKEVKVENNVAKINSYLKRIIKLEWLQNNFYKVVDFLCCRKSRRIRDTGYLGL